MLRKIVILLSVPALLLTLTTVSSTAAYAPPTGPMFNSPWGARGAQDRILTHIRHAIEHTPKHQTIQIASYSFDRPDIGDALIKAYHRGVRVQMVLNDNWISKQTKRLQRVIGKNTNKSSFVTICYRACRGGAGNQHSKFYLFSRTGAARNVVMVGSANLTGYGAKSQWNDMFTLNGRPEMRRGYAHIFKQLVADHRIAHPFRVLRNGTLTSRFYPHNRTTKTTDPVMRRLNQVRCKAPHGTGYRGNTLIRISMYGWQGTRGNYLADKVAGLSRHGCRIRVILSSQGRRVAGKLMRGGVQVRSASYGLRKDGSYQHYTHEKWMIVNGSFGKHAYRGVWTGSQNWSNQALMNDEVTLQVPARYAYRRYAQHFNSVWSSKHTYRLESRTDSNNAHRRGQPLT